MGFSELAPNGALAWMALILPGNFEVKMLAEIDHTATLFRPAAFAS